MSSALHCTLLTSGERTEKNRKNLCSSEKPSKTRALPKLSGAKRQIEKASKWPSLSFFLLFVQCPNNNTFCPIQKTHIVIVRTHTHTQTHIQPSRLLKSEKNELRQNSLLVLAIPLWVCNKQERPYWIRPPNRPRPSDASVCDELQSKPRSDHTCLCASAQENTKLHGLGTRQCQQHRQTVSIMARWQIGLGPWQQRAGQLSVGKIAVQPAAPASTQFAQHEAINKTSENEFDDKQRWK